ncbi:hypothetical protein H0H93_002934 [Arthromyces matolae]|nr:hypothetical protein H0H93_002934 [Arthromyces matolae]
MLVVLNLLLLPLLAIAQSNSTNQTVITSTSLATYETLGPNRQISTGTSSYFFFSTVSPTQTASGNSSVSANSTISGNNTASANATSSSTSPTSTQILPTAPTTISAGGGTAGAPLPGATGGAYGPDDKYIAAASILARNTPFVVIGGLFVSGALMVL